MSKKLFNELERQQLKQNKYVLEVSDKAITYTDEFKLHFISEYDKGLLPRFIFEQAGFSVDIIGMARIRNASLRWRQAYEKSGVMGLRDTRKNNLGRPRSKELTKDEIINRQNSEIAYLKAELELVKKLELEERRVMTGKISPTLVFQLIERVIQNHNLSGVTSHLCEIAGVSRSGYYRFLNTHEIRRTRDEKDATDFNIIKKAYDFKGYSKGSRGIYMALKNVFGVVFNLKKIQRLMRKFKLICPIRKSNPYKRIAKATKEHSVVPNLLQRRFKEGNPAQILLTDITYIPFRGRFAYLSVIKDSISNEILAYHLSKNIKLEIVLKTLDKLIQNHGERLDPKVMIHSDQGSHYTSPNFQKRLRQANIIQSMSRRGNCWDNAPMESFFGHMKDEVIFNEYESFDEVQTAVDNYVEYYNNDRYQWNLKKLTPVLYRNQLLAA